ncbi:hypothetical protein ILYODFUR_017553 [Ilyodon furcidens]|uniref:Uncharacterized protein n=1 Tax=Ilyodon furcidens TaxID=33524 RepID=A0ABV0SYA3_9TELE
MEFDCHCYRHLKKRAAERVSGPKVNVSAGGRYTVAGKPTLVCPLLPVVFGSGFPVGLENRPLLLDNSSLVLLFACLNFSYRETFCYLVWEYFLMFLFATPLHR